MTKPSSWTLLNLCRALAIVSCVLAVVVVGNAMVAYALPATTIEINRSCHSCWYLLAVAFGTLGGTIYLLFDRPRAHKFSLAAFLFAMAAYASWIGITVAGFRTGQVNCGFCYPAESSVDFMLRGMGWTWVNVVFPLVVLVLLVCEIALIRRKMKAGSDVHADRVN